MPRNEEGFSKKFVQTDGTRFSTRTGHSIFVGHVRVEPGSSNRVYCLPSGAPVEPVCPSIRLPPLEMETLSMFLNLSRGTLMITLCGYDLREARVEDLIIDGNKAENLPLNGCRGAGIFLYRGFGTVISN